MNVCKHGHPLSMRCSRCVEDRHVAEERRAEFPAKLDAAVSELREEWRENGGDYYPISEQIAEKHGVDVWLLRETWLAPFHEARARVAAL